MRKIALIVLAIGVILILQGCATSQKEIPEPEGTLLSHRELEQLFKKECTFDYKSTSGEWGTETHYPTGETKVHWKVRGYSGRLTGTYTIENGQICNKWDDSPLHVKCHKFYKIGENIYHTTCTNCSDNPIETLTFR